MTWWWPWLLTTVGVVGLLLAGRKVKWAWLVGLSAQGLWLVYAIVTGQWGFVGSALAYGYVYARNAWLWMREPPESVDS